MSQNISLPICIKSIYHLVNRWYNLDSTLSAPSYISDTYLGLFLAQLKSDSYHIFVVRGNLARSEGDDFIDTSPEDQIPYHTKVSSPKKALPQGRSLNEKTQEELELEKAIAMSFGPLEGDGEATDEEALLQMAIDQSLQQDRTSSTRKADDAQLPVDEMRQKRLNKFLG